MSKEQAMSKHKNPAPPAVENGIKARVLVDGAFGKVNDVVEVDPEVAHGGELDTSPEAVAYAESLKAE